jgi:hypothetical protein
MGLDYLSAGGFQRHREHVHHNECVGQYVDVSRKIFHVAHPLMRIIDLPLVGRDRNFDREQTPFFAAKTNRPKLIWYPQWEFSGILPSD